jgi:hypothetical protein
MRDVHLPVLTCKVDANNVRLIVTARQQPIQLPAGSRAILEAAALLDEPFSVPWLIDLGFSTDALDPLFDKDILCEQLLGE